MLVDGRAFSSPKINGKIDGDTEITGSFTEADRRRPGHVINNHLSQQSDAQGESPLRAVTQTATQYRRNAVAPKLQHATVGLDHPPRGHVVLVARDQHLVQTQLTGLSATPPPPSPSVALPPGRRPHVVADVPALLAQRLR